MKPPTVPEPKSEFSLNGQLLVAMPGMPDPRFERTVVYLCAHSSDGAMGLVINRPADEIAFIDLLRQLDIVRDKGPSPLPEKACEVHVLRGGPVETSRGFVLHSALPDKDFGSVQVDDGVGLSANVDILRAIAKGEGPDHALFALGYAGWGAGQLESEIQDNGWILCPATSDLLFDENFETKYERALESIGIDLAMLSTAAGHA